MGGPLRLGPSDVTGWAAAGDGSLAVLSGEFDLTTIETQLVAAGYESSTYRGVRVLAIP